METVIIVIHLMVIIALVALVLMQRSEGGALGIGGGGNFMSARGQGNILTRSTGILAAAFFATSIALTVLANIQGRPSDILDAVPATSAPATPGTGEGILDELNGLSPQAPAADGAAPALPDPSGAAAPADPTVPAAPASPQVPTSQ